VPEDLALDLLDTDYLDILDRLLSGEDGDAAVKARLRYRQGRPAEAADLLAARRRYLEIHGTNDHMAAFFAAQAETHLTNRQLDAYVTANQLARDAESGVAVPANHHHVYAYYFDLKALSFQEAVYRQAARDLVQARRLKALGGDPPSFSARWAALGKGPEADAIAAFDTRYFKRNSSYDLIRGVIEMRDTGNYEAAAQYIKNIRWVAVAAEANGEYIDAQTLWQMAFTFARVGEADIAFDLMDRAARIAARLSFDGAGGAGGGTLQLLERDRGRYLSFVDIAWAALSGQAPQDMLVVSRY
jgi:hypothetical protein